MGIDYYSCEICGTAFPDVIHYGHCGKCEEVLCGRCYDEMREKYGELGEEHERASWYGEEAPNCCDACMKEETHVTITKEEYEQLKKDSELLACLEACGVDNWGGWDDAIQMMIDEEEED